MTKPEQTSDSPGQGTEAAPGGGGTDSSPPERDTCETMTLECSKCRANQQLAEPPNPGQLWICKRCGHTGEARPT